MRVFPHHRRVCDCPTTCHNTVDIEMRSSRGSICISVSQIRTPCSLRSSPGKPAYQTQVVLPCTITAVNDRLDKRFMLRCATVGRSPAWLACPPGRMEARGFITPYAHPLEGDEPATFNGSPFWPKILSRQPALLVLQASRSRP